MDRLCRRQNCHNELLSEEELESGTCDECCDELAARHAEREDWDYFHS